MKKIITSIILVGAFFVCAYTSESAETDKYAYIVCQVNGVDTFIRIDKKTDKKEASLFTLPPTGPRLKWVDIKEEE